MPTWLLHYRREWLRRDIVAGLIVWSVVVPQAVAYAQIAGLPPSAGLIAAPGALLAYALLGTSRTLVVSATTATSALSAAAVGPLADGDAARFAALSAGLAVISAGVLAGAGLLRLGGVMDLVSKPVMTGFLFGLGLTIAIGQLPKIFGVEEGSGRFFGKLWDLLADLGDTQGWTLAVGAGSIVLLVALGRLAPAVPATLVVLVLSIAVSALLDLAGRGVDVVGDLSARPRARALAPERAPVARARPTDAGLGSFRSSAGARLPGVIERVSHRSSAWSGAKQDCRQSTRFQGRSLRLRGETWPYVTMAERSCQSPA